jgi:aminoglycoside phosphotransferase (APT) family kinase protein
MSESRVIDQARGVRPGEELDAGVVTGWLRFYGVDLIGQPEVTQFSGGASNWTYRLKYENRDLILRRPPKGTRAKSAHDMVREYTVQKGLKPVYPAVPEMVALCTDHSVIGDDFYVMDRIEGIIPRRHLPRGLALSEAEVRKLCLGVLDKLIELHQVDYRAAGLEQLGKGAGYTQRQVEGWTSRMARARTWNVSDFRYVTDWLRERMPKDVRICLIHNDWRFDNVVLAPHDPTKVIGVLDWEMATLGDPLMELGSMLAYWVEPGDDFLMKSTQRQPTTMKGMLTRREVVDYYLTRTGLTAEDWTFHEVFGLFRLAVIAQQIYYRYHHKQTRNPAFRHYWAMVNYCAWRCRRLIRRHA